MTLFGCDHRWTEVGRTFTPPANRAVEGYGGPELLERLSFGITNIEQRCEACGKVTVNAFVGRVGDAHDGRAA